MKKKTKARQLVTAVRCAFRAQLGSCPDQTQLTVAYSTDGA